MASPVPSPTNPLSSHTLERLKNAIEQGQTHASYDEVRMVRMILAKTRRIAPHELAEFLGPNPIQIARVVSSVQEMGLIPIQNITHALHTVGYTKVRNVFTSIMLLDCAEQKIGEIEQQKAASICLASGLVARALTKRISRIDPEISFICASLQGLGKLLLTTLLMPDYRRARMLFATTQPHIAFEKVFGITPENLVPQMASYFQLPEEILESFPSDTPPTSESNRDLRELAQLSYDLTILLEASTLSTEEFIAQAILKTKNDRLASILSKDDIWYIFGDAHEQIQSLNGGDGLAVLRNPLLSKIESIVLGESLHSGVSSEIYSQIDAPERQELSEAALEFAQINANERPKRQIRFREIKRKSTVNPHAPSNLAIEPPKAEPKNIPPEPKSCSTGIKKDQEKTAQPPPGNSPDAPKNKNPSPQSPASPIEPHEDESDDGSREIEQITQILKSPPVDTKKLLQLATRALQLRLVLNQTVTFVENEKGWFYAHSGSGRLFREIRDQSLFHRDDPTLFKDAIERGDTLVFEKMDPKKHAGKIPDWLEPHISNTTLTILPLKISSDRWMLTLGIKHSAPGMTQEQLALIQGLKEKLSQAPQ